MAYTGDVPANTIVLGHSSLLRNAADTGFITPPIDNRLFVVNVASPKNTMTIVFAYIYEGVTITSVDGICAGGSDVEVVIKEQSTPYSAGTTIMIFTPNTASKRAVVTTPYATTAGSFLSIIIGTVTGSVNNVIVSLNGYVT